MIRRLPIGCWTLGSAAWLLAAAGGPDQDRPVFRAATSTVSVNVSVKRGNQPLLGLTTADFELTDNGVHQVVDDVSRDAVPIDATLLVDTSGSVAGVVERLKKDTGQIIAMLRPIDRFRLLTFDRYVNEMTPLQSVDAPQPPPYATDHGARRSTMRSSRP